MNQRKPMIMKRAPVAVAPPSGLSKNFEPLKKPLQREKDANINGCFMVVLLAFFIGMMGFLYYVLIGMKKPGSTLNTPAKIEQYHKLETTIDGNRSIW